MAGEACVAGGGEHGKGYAWQGGMHGGGHAWQESHVWWGACVAGGAVCVAGWCAWQDIQPLQRTVYILLECILVINADWSFSF